MKLLVSLLLLLSVDLMFAGTLGIRRSIAISRGASNDPNLLLKLVTHNGDNVPVGLYQDTAATIPATTEADPVAAWKDMRSGGTVFTQAVGAGQPFLTFISGVPMVEFSDGQWLMGSKTWTGTSALTVVTYEPDDSAFTVFDAGSLADTWTRFSDGNSYMATFRATRVEGFFASPSTGDNILSLFSDSSEYTAWLNGTQVATTTGNFQNSDTEVSIGIDTGENAAKFYNGRISSIFVHTDKAKREELEALAAELANP